MYSYWKYSLNRSLIRSSSADTWVQFEGFTTSIFGSTIMADEYGLRYSGPCDSLIDAHDES